MNVTEKRNSELFRILSWMGLLATEDASIRHVRTNDGSLFETLDLTYSDINRVGYLNPHVTMPLSYKDKTELWLGDQYLNPRKLDWVETSEYLHAILDSKYDESVDVKCYYNPNIIYRYSNVAPNETEEYVHVITIDITDIRYSEIRHIERSAFYISQNKICVPTAKFIDDQTIEFRAPYKGDIDFFICSNLVNTVAVTAGEGVYIDQPHSNYCYHRMVVDHDAAYPIDARFYPCITVDKDCTVRVYSDSYHSVLHPEVCRLMLYPEFIDVVDPYTSDNEYLKSVEPVDDIILATDSDNEIFEKFAKIAKYCYRMWEKYPTDGTEQSDFVICDNSKLANKVFSVQTLYRNTEAKEYICSTVPYEHYRDIIMYNGVMFDDYAILNIRKTKDGKYVEDPINGKPVYVIDTKYNPDGFTVIKFNTAEDTVVMNIGEYIDENNVVRLHYKLNRFFRNLLVIRREFLDSNNQDYARIATVQPSTTDSYLWLELLVNAIPEMFETRPIETIDLMGLDPAKMPKEIVEGAYQLDLGDTDGPMSYSQLMMTYYKLNKNLQKYLVLQYGSGEDDDPRIKVFHDLRVGKLNDNEELNAVVIESDQGSTDVVDSFKGGIPEEPETAKPGDLYAQDMSTELDPELHNVPIDKISVGPNTPTPDKSTLWVKTDSEQIEGVVRKDQLDGTTGKTTFVNDPSEIANPSEGEYVIESNDDSFERTEEISISDLLTGGEQQPEETEESFFDQIAKAVADNTKVGDITAPKVGQMALDDINFIDHSTGNAITIDDIAKLPTEQKVGTVRKLITDDDEPTNPQIGDLWNHYLSTMNPDDLNTVVYKLLLARHVYDLNQLEPGDLAIEGEGMPEQGEASLDINTVPQLADKSKMIIQPVGVTDPDDNSTPDYDLIKDHNVKYIMSITEPDNVSKSDLWLKMPAATLTEIEKDVFSAAMSEIGFNLPDGVFSDDGQVVAASMGLDYYAHDTGTEGVGELFRVKDDPTLHPIYYGDEVNGVTLHDDDLWFEFLDDIADKVAYSDQTCMVINLNERLYLLQFDKSDITVLAFDDMLINFRGKLGVKYLSIIADLINSGNIKLDDVNIFYKRLITHEDTFDPRLQRLYTGTSHIVATSKIDTTDLAILYSSNIGRFRMDYSSDDTTNREREAAYRMVIDYSNRDFALLRSRMLIFVNGKYIPSDEYAEDFAGKIQLLNFNELISTVDILYSVKDKPLMELKRLAYKHWPVADTSESIQRPSEYGKMEPIKVFEYTKKGYYDVLLDEYIFNGRLLRMLKYLEEHPDEIDEFKRDLIQKFHAISDIDLSGLSVSDSKIVISGNSSETAEYQIKE